jgi:hypothetical protein
MREWLNPSRNLTAHRTPVTFNQHSTTYLHVTVHAISEVLTLF